MSHADLASRIKQQAAELGFDLCGIAAAANAPTFGNLQEWLEQGFAGEMHYIERRESAYEHPAGVMESVASIIVLGMNYHTRDDAPSPPSSGLGQVARYARGAEDYHDVLRRRLKQLATVLHEARPDCRTRGVVDTAPLLERDFARLAGLGWFGKNTMLINKRAGSYLFLAALLTDIELPADAPHETAHCGTCTRCLEACPTDAFPEAYVLDATRCISYLTIELRDQPIPLELREGVGDWLFGCDICQEVCPWNKKAPSTSDTAWLPRDDLTPIDAIELLRMDAAEFDRRFGSTPLSRPGHAGMRRNAAIVLGNQRDPAALPVLREALDDADLIVRDAARWAVSMISDVDD